MRCLVLCLSVLLAGCAARQGPARSYRLVPAGAGHVLMPPRPHAEQPGFKLTNARSVTTVTPSCAVDAADFSLRWRGRTAEVRANAEPLAPLPGTLLEGRTTSGGNIQTVGDVIVSRNWFEEDFRPALGKLKASGCIAPQDVQSFDLRMIENLPLPSSTLYRLRYGNYALVGYIDLDAQFRLRSVEPIRERGEVVGYRTAFYPLLPAERGGVRVTRGESESNVRGVLTAGSAPDAEVLQLPEDATYLRVFFRTWSITQDRRIALIAARSQAELEKASTDFEANPEGFCATSRQHGVSCVAVPKEMVLSGELRVRANGRDRYVAVGEGVGAVLREEGIRETEAVLRTLKVSRPYNRKLTPVQFDRADGRILGLVLIGGEELSW